MEYLNLGNPTMSDQDHSLPPGARHPDPVGNAHMRADRTLELRLFTEAPGGVVGEAMMIVKPDDPRHAGLVAHLGAIEPGGYASIPPIPPGVL